MAKPANNPTRLLLATAVLKGSLFRLRVLDRARAGVRSVTPEVGLDMDLILRFYRQMETRQTGVQLAQILLLGLAVLSAASTEPWLVVVVLLSLLVHFLKMTGDRHHYLPKLYRENFDQADFRRQVNTHLSGQEEEAVSDPAQNVIVYSGFNPFVGSGVQLGMWSFAIDVTRRAENSPSQSPLQFRLLEFLDTIGAAADRLELRHTEVRDTLFIKGSDIPKDGLFQSDRHSRPRQLVDPAVVGRFVSRSDESVRAYKWIRVHDWDDDLVVSFFLRATVNGKTLFVEFCKRILGPLGDKYRRVDSMPRSGVSALISFVLETILETIISWPFAVIAAPVALWWKISLAMREMFGTDARELRREIEANPLYDYGAQASLREEVAGDGYVHYFQRMDKELCEKAIEKQVLDSIVDFLDGLGIDTSDLRERQNTILNQGIVLQGGDVNAQSLAVGAGAKANSVLGRVGLQKRGSAA